MGHIDLVNLLSHLFVQLAPVLLLPLIGWGGKKLLAWLDAHTHNAALQGIFGRLEATAEMIVRQRLQESIEDLKAAAADGKITEDELAAELKKQKDEALAQLKGLLSLGKIKDVLGLNAESLGHLLSASLEAALHKVKNPLVHK